MRIFQERDAIRTFVADADTLDAAALLVETLVAEGRRAECAAIVAEDGDGHVFMLVDEFGDWVE